MRFTSRTTLSLLSIFTLIFNAPVPAFTQDQAAPTAPPFRVLVMTSKASDHLQMIAAARPFFQQLAKDQGYTVDITDDTSRITDKGLAPYAVFVMLQLAPFDMSAGQQAALQRFVEQGKGWVGIHAAGLTGKQFILPGTPYWQWFENMMGGVTYSPHPAYQKGTLVIEDHEHPVTRGLPDRLAIADEWYEFNRSPRDHVRVLASADESAYHQNHPMGDHPLVWVNERFSRMIYIGIGHDASIFQSPGYVQLVSNAIRWASTDYKPGVKPVVTRNELPAIPIPMKGRIVSYEQTWLLAGTRREDLLHYTNDTLIRVQDGVDSFRIFTGKDDHYYWIRFATHLYMGRGKYVLRADQFYEKPNMPGVSHEYSKIEYRWWDFRLGHPWSVEDRRLFEGIDSASREWLAAHGQALELPRFRVLALYENGGHHVAFSARARQWLDKLAADSNFAIDYLQHTDSIDYDLLNHYRLIIQLDYVPYAWKEQAMRAFRDYITQGKGGWVGLHHASLLGDFDGYPMWDWFSSFMGGIKWKDYIPGFADGIVRVEDKGSPIMRGVPDSFRIEKEEWYTYDRSPRPNVHVLASVDESTYQPASAKKMGDHPVIWTNEHVNARNVYIFMGHGPGLFDNAAFTSIFLNAISWASAGNN